MVLFKIREVLGGDSTTKQDSTSLCERLVRQVLGVARRPQLLAERRERCL
jgi:hypothetical protein